MLKTSTLGPEGAPETTIPTLDMSIHLINSHTPNNGRVHQVNKIGRVIKKWAHKKDNIYFEDNVFWSSY